MDEDESPFWAAVVAAPMRQERVVNFFGERLHIGYAEHWLGAEPGK